MKEYLVITRNSILGWLAYRFHFIFTCVTNILFIFMIWFLWKAIYADASNLHGMTFAQTFIYLSIASSLSFLFASWAEWEMSGAVISGNIVMAFLQPLDLQLRMFFESIGFMLCNLVAMTVPAVLIITFAFDSGIRFGLNFLFFFISIFFSFCLCFIFDFITGLASFYTESIWGISMCKQFVVNFLSGALVPVAFFPEFLKAIIMMLPFQAVYNVPLTILTDNRLGVADYLRLICVQAGWIVALAGLSRILFVRARRVITVNGG